MQGASLQCMQATEMLFSPATPSLSVTTRRRFTPHGTLCSALQAVTQPLHSMQRSASQMNFILAIVFSVAFRVRQAVARWTWHTVVFVSCIIVTLS
jgi:predicted component of type VI protein secretion system